MAWNIATSSPNRTLAAMAGRRRGEWEGGRAEGQTADQGPLCKTPPLFFLFFFPPFLLPHEEIWKNEQLPSAVSSDLDRSLAIFLGLSQWGFLSTVS
jgi:hypothetical protein